MWNSIWPWRPSWILVCTSSFEFFNLGMVFCISFSNLIKIGEYLPKLQPAFWNPIWPPPPSWFTILTSGFQDLSIVNWDAFSVKISSKLVYRFKSYGILFVCSFIMDYPYTCSQFRGFWGKWPPICKLISVFHHVDSSLHQTASFEPLMMKIEQYLPEL